MKELLSIFTICLALFSTFGGVDSSGAGGGHGSGKSSVQGEFDSQSPRVSYGGDHFISEGSTFDITCILTVFDQLKWTLNGSLIKFEANGYSVAEITAPQGFIGSRLSVEKSGKEHAGDYKCTTFSPLSHSVYILSAGKGGSTETTKLLRTGYPLPLECKITQEEGVAVALTWSKDNSPITESNDQYKIFKENSTLLIVSATQDDVGVYQCKADPLNKTFNISVVFLMYKSMTKSLTVLEGDKLALTCDAEGNPMPSITWQKDGKNVEDVVNETRYTLEDNERGTNNATFSILTAVYDDRAEYTCIIGTADIQYNTTTFVRVKDKYAALWPFLGICAEVFVLCLIIFVYEKRRAKNDFEESDTDQPTDTKNTSDQNKDSVRHRK